MCFIRVCISNAMCFSIVCVGIRRRCMCVSVCEFMVSDMSSKL